MKMSKAKYHGQLSYNDYDVELSWGQLEAIRAALEAKHDDVVSDELLAELAYYMEMVPGPGEDEEKIEAEQKAAEGGTSDENEDLPIPMPPGTKAGTPPETGGEEPPFPPESGEGQPTPAARKLGAKPKAEVGLPEPGMDDDEAGEAGEAGGMPPEETDKRLPPPPRE